MPNKGLAHILLGLIVAAYLAVGTLYAALTPPWQAPDEPAHYNYIAQVAADGCCPVIEAGDWDQDYLSELTASQFPDEADLAPIEYEDHQPPLYYLLGSLVYTISGGSLLALRLMSVAIGAGIVIAAFYAVTRLFPAHRVLGLAAALFVAFVPQHVAILASVNNDSLAGLVLGVLLVVVLAYLGNPLSLLGGGGKEPLSDASRPHAAAVGGLIGIAFLTKLTIYGPAVLAGLLAILLRWRIERHRVGWLLGQMAWAGSLALALGAVWWGRNIAVYGWPDFWGQITHNAVVVGQLRTAELIASIGFGPYLARFLITTYNSFWGQFGWMGVPMPRYVYWLIGLFLIGVALAPVGLLAGFRRRPALEPQQKAALGIFAAVMAITVLQHIYYNLTFVQFQGRYLFPMLIPLSLLITASLQCWVLILKRWLTGEGWDRALAWLPLVVLGWLPVLALFALFRFVIPNLG